MSYFNDKELSLEVNSIVLKTYFYVIDISFDKTHFTYI